MDPGEECDDGNRVNGDGCEADCTLPKPVCGNEIVESGEDCDDGAGLCAANSAMPGRPCNTDDDCDDDPACDPLEADCSGLCQDAEGGDAGTPCSTPGACNTNGLPDACRTNCKAATCGDGIVDTGEQCDDSNTVSGDGCSATCQLE
jgi:cysteine-rich repeat protein